MTEYILSEKALEDLNNIWIYTAENWSIEQADRYYNLIIDEIEIASTINKGSKGFNFFEAEFRINNNVSNNELGQALRSGWEICK